MDTLTDKKYDRTLKEKFLRCKDDSKITNREFNLTLEQYENLVNKGCYYCTKLLVNIESGYSLDRIDSSKGYTLDNVLPCCGECNRIRSNKYTVKQMQEIGKILNNFKEVYCGSDNRGN